MIRKGFVRKDGAARLTSKRAAAPQKEGLLRSRKRAWRLTAGDRRKNMIAKNLPVPKSPRRKLFQRDDDFVRPDHVHALARHGLDGASVGA